MANPDAFIDEYISLYHPGEKFAQRPDVRGLLPDARLQGPGDHREGIRWTEADLRARALPEALFRRELYRDAAPSEGTRIYIGRAAQGLAEYPS